METMMCYLCGRAVNVCGPWKPQDVRCDECLVAPAQPNKGEQPAPVPSNGADINALLIEHIKRRAEKGERTYGVRLQPFNGRNAKLDQIDELLDAAVYGMQEMEERRLLEEENRRLREENEQLRLLIDPEPPVEIPDYQRKKVTGPIEF